MPRKRLARIYRLRLPRRTRRDKKVFRSKWEISVADLYAKEFRVSCNDRRILGPWEVDVVVHDGSCTWLVEVNGPGHYTPDVYGEVAHRRTVRNDLLKLKKAQKLNLRLLVIPAKNRMPSEEELKEGLRMLMSSAGSFSLLFENMGAIKI